MLSYVPRQFVGRLEPDTSVISAEVLHLISEPLLLLHKPDWTM